MTDATAPPALAVADLTFAYAKGRPALDGVCFEAPQSSFTALLGPNGAGKTTLMALVTRLFRARRGKIRVQGIDLDDAPRAALAAMGVVFQQLTLDLDLTVEQNLHYAAALQGLTLATARERIAAGLTRARLEDRRGTKVRTLRGGLRRRVALVRSLSHRPKLLILDEPTVGLDIESRQQLVAEVHDLCRTEGLAALWTTHLIDEVWPEDRLVVLHQGEARAAGTVADVLAETGTTDIGDAFARLTGGDRLVPDKGAA